MKLSNFKFLRQRQGLLDIKDEFAEVDVDTGILWWKRKSRQVIFKNGIFWKFVDSGEFMPGRQAEMLADSEVAKQGFANVRS